MRLFILGGLRYLAPTFDHASSLGAHHADATRARRLESNDPAFRVEVFPIPEQNAEGRYRSTYFVHGLRHRGPSAEEEVRRLRPGDALALEAESENPHDPRALRIHTVVRGVHIGFVPRYLCQDVHALLSAAGEQAEVRVQRVNPPPTPAQFRVLCSLDSMARGVSSARQPRLRSTPLIRPRRARVGSRVARAGSIRAMTVQLVCPCEPTL